jgi:hypothetical protein
LFKRHTAQREREHVHSERNAKSEELLTCPSDLISRQ